MFRSIKSVWVSWLLVTLISTTLGVTLGAIPLVLLPNDDSPTFEVLLLLISGLFIGIAQWIILRSKLFKTGQWILATTIGLPFGFLFGSVMLAIMPNFPEISWIRAAVVAAIGGMITGFLQWRALHSKLTGSLLWLLVSALSWGIASGFAAFIFDTYLSNWDFEYSFVPFLGMLVGGIIGIISGAFVEIGIIQTISKSQLT